MRRSIVLALLIVAATAALSLSLAGHVAGIIANMQFQPAANPVYWVAGSNAGTLDVTGKSISVTISPNGTTATVSADLVYGINQYIDLLEINVTNAPYTLYIVADPTSTIFNSTYIDLQNSELIIYNVSGTVLAKIPLANLSTGTPQPANGITASVNGLYRVDLVIVMKDGLPLPSSPFTLNLDLYYTKSSEKPITP